VKDNLKFHKDENNMNRKIQVIPIWFQAASMGEFEQAKPVIELLKSDYPDSNIVVSLSFLLRDLLRKKNTNLQIIFVICHLILKKMAKHFICKDFS